MRTLFSILAATFLFSGCHQRNSVKHTAFFNKHDAQAHLESVAQTKGYDVGGGGSGHSLGGTVGEKDVQISIKGNHSIRDAIMQGYKSFVEKALNDSGVTINGRGVSGEVSGFDYNYHQSGLTGIVRVTSTVDSDGYIQIDVFVYEHQ